MKQKPMKHEDDSIIEYRSTFTRRRFLKNFVVGTAVSSFMGRGWLGTLVADCQPVQQGAGILRVNISGFEALKNENGSVRLALNAFTLTGTSNAFYPVLVNRGANNQFFALDTSPCHSSRFRIDGTVVPGSPATRPLQSFPVSFDGVDLLCIEIATLGYTVSETSVQSGAAARFQLQFATRTGVKYQVLFRPSLADAGAGVVVPFATTIGGAATATVLTGNNAAATLFVDRTSDAGFYSIAVQVNPG
ncbi:MAG: hypothetical protein DME23_19735 [Verrucomicrobia bacterium]|nr:MAG: hypothetical protein DME23_19735 [Verrucomicrobiota bacterium]